jgi:tetratricopeptide (TPR) repeat protein
MSAAPPNAPVTDPRPRSPRRRLLWSALLLTILMAAGAGGWIWYRQAPAVPTPPEPDLDGVDPAVAAVINKEREGVLQAPRSAAAWGRLGEALTEFNYRREAVLALAQAERLDPREPRWPYLQGWLLLKDDAEGAIPRLRRAVELCGDNFVLPQLRLNEALLAQGHLEEAEAGFAHLLKRDPLHAGAHLGLGRLAVRRQHWREALPHLQLAAADHHTARAATIALAEVYQRLGDETAAAQCRKQLEVPHPDQPWPDKFLQDVERFRTIGKRNRLMEADRLIKQRRVMEAIARYEQVVEDYPDSPEGRSALGQALYRIGNYAGAEGAFKKTVELAPGFAEAHNFLGLAQREQGKLEAAAASFRKAAELKPDFAIAYSNLGRCLLAQKDRAGALQAFRAAVRCKPDYAAAYIDLAELLHERGQDAEALEQVRQALQLNPTDPRAKELLKTLAPKR